LDEAVIYLTATNRTPSWIRLVFGNDGWDVINDYTINLEEDLKSTFQLADDIVNGLA
jgi:hypothetical protein